MPPNAGDNDGPSIRELARSLEGLATQLRDVVIELRGLGTIYVPRAEHELQIGGVKVDLRRIDEETQRLDREHSHDIRETRAAMEKADERLSAALGTSIGQLTEALNADRRDRVAGNRWAIGLGLTAIGLVISGAVALATILPTLVGS